MTDAITPASLRAHADWIDGCGHGLGPGEALRAEAARLEAESARGETYVLELAKVFRDAQGYETSLDRYSAEVVEDWKRPIRAVLDRLAADGRLLPEGEDRTVYDDTTLERVYRGLAAAGIELRQAVDVVNQIQNQGILFRQSPDDDYDTPPAVSVPDSGPDGTPEKPWPSLRAVPVPVREVRDRHGLRWERHSDTEWRGCDWSSACAAGHPEDAPFVRVDGDKA